MAHPNEREFLRLFLEDHPATDWPEPLKSGRVLEIGSKQYGHGIDYRPMFPGIGWLGVDQEAGPGVDVVGNVEDRKTLSGEKFSAVLCCSVLEHSQRPWLLADVIDQHLLTGGLLYVSVPWIWRYHPYPADYWRMSPDAIRVLFPAIDWKKISYASQKKGEFLDAKYDFNKAPWRQLQGPRVALITQMVLMIGRKR